MNAGTHEDIRWKQRFQNYAKALASLTSAVQLAESRELSDLEKQGVIQAFEFSFELAWNVMKDYLEAQGILGITGSRNAIRQAFANNLIADGQVWMQMIQDRNLASHSYSEETAQALVFSIITTYSGCFADFAKTMDGMQ